MMPRSPAVSPRLVNGRGPNSSYTCQTITQQRNIRIRKEGVSRVSVGALIVNTKFDGIFILHAVSSSPVHPPSRPTAKNSYTGGAMSCVCRLVLVDNGICWLTFVSGDDDTPIKSFIVLPRNSAGMSYCWARSRKASNRDGVGTI